MNVFRLAGDVSHLVAIIILLLKIWRSKSCAGMLTLTSMHSHSLHTDMIVPAPPQLSSVQRQQGLKVFTNAEKVCCCGCQLSALWRVCALRRVLQEWKRRGNVNKAICCPAPPYYTAACTSYSKLTLLNRRTGRHRTFFLLMSVGCSGFCLHMKR